MPRTILDMSVSLDGFCAGPNETIDNGLGDGGQRLHDWGMPRAADGSSLDTPLDEVDAAMMAAYRSAGASVCGRGTVDPAGGLGWRCVRGAAGLRPRTHGARSRGAALVAVHLRRDHPGGDRPGARGGRRRRRRRAGAGTGQAAIAAGLLDEVSLHVVPIMLRTGRRLLDLPGGAPLDLDLVEVRQGAALHLRYRLLRWRASG